MEFRDQLIWRFSERATETVVRKAIRVLRAMPGVLSGADSELLNIWDEYCAQVQGEESTFWDEYEETVRQVVRGQCSGLEVPEREAVWLQTDRGIDWSFDQEDGYAGTIPVDDDDLVEHLANAVRNAAADYSNRRIERFLERPHD